MSGSLRIARLFGIEIRAHFTFFLLLLVVALDAGQAGGPRAALFGVALILALFACVTLHELGHSLVARRFGGKVREIVLLPIGGMARLLREPVRPLHELLTALAGPLVNVAIAFALAMVLAQRVGDVSEVARLAQKLEPSQNAFLAWLLAMNMMLAAFNLLPALPMDGGRVLRAVLASFLGRMRATAIAASVGQVLALGLVLLGLFGQPANPILLLIGAFVFFGASQERRASRASEIVSDLLAGEVCNPSSHVLSPTDDLGDVVDQSLRTNQAFFPVVYGTGLLGIVLRSEALRAAPRLGLRAPVSQVMRRNLPACTADTPLIDVRERVLELGLPVVVLDEGRLVGILGPEDLARIAEVSSLLAGAGIKRPKAAKSEVEAPSSELDAPGR